MVMNAALKTISPFVPVAGSAYGFARTCVRVYNATTLTKALIAGAKGIVIDCTPPVIKYLLLCSGAILYGGAAVVTGDPNFAVGVFECCNAIVEA